MTFAGPQYVFVADIWSVRCSLMMVAALVVWSTGRRLACVRTTADKDSAWGCLLLTATMVQQTSILYGTINTRNDHHSFHPLHHVRSHRISPCEHCSHQVSPVIVSQIPSMLISVILDIGANGIPSSSYPLILRYRSLLTKITLDRPPLLVLILLSSTISYGLTGKWTKSNLEAGYPHVSPK